MSHPKLYPWECPIAHMVPREPDFTATGDASLFAEGGLARMNVTLIHTDR